MNLNSAIKKIEINLEKFKETEVYRDSVFSTVAEVECVMCALEIIKLNSYETRKAYLLSIADTCYSEALFKIILEFLDDLKKVKVKEEDNMTFIEFCKEEFVRILNCTDKKITTGEELGLYIAENVRIPEGKDQQDQLKEAWADELLEYFEFAYEEGNLEANPFSDQSKFLKNAVSQAIKIMIQFSDTCNVNWVIPINLLNEKHTIVEEIIAIESIIFEEMF